MSKPKKRKAAGLAPGTLVFTGEQFVEIPRVRLIQFDGDQLTEQESLNQLPAAAAGPPVTWYDLRGLHKVELIAALGNQFQVHPLVLEDVLETSQRPKFEEYENGVFLSLQALHSEDLHAGLTTEQVAVFAGEGFVLSFQEREEDLFLPVRERLRAARGKIRQRSGDYLLYALADAVADRYFFLLDCLEEAIETLEAEILERPTNDSKGRIHQLKRSALAIRRSVAPLREAINNFARSEHPVIKEPTPLFCRDLHDHLVQIMDSIDGQRDILNGLYDLYLSEISYRMNAVMRTLTIISTIFIPLTFLAGIYGMNFEHMPELHWRWGYFLLWGLMVAIALILLLLFKRKQWL